MDNQKQNNNLINVGTQNEPLVNIDANLLFSGDSYGLFLFKKTERIVTAIYLLTGLMADKEPMKERLRTLATEMLENVLGMSERVWGEETYQKNLLNATYEISVLFDVAESSKMISVMNHKIISEELKKLINFLVTSSSNYSSAKIAFEPNLFDGNYNYVPEQNYQVKASNLQEANPDFSKGQKDIKDNSKNNTSDKISATKTPKGEKVIKDKSNRQEIIISMLKSGAKLNIKDLAKNIKNCSEKTIQRELISMVAKGVLKKEGERRWSKYFLA